MASEPDSLVVSRALVEVAVTYGGSVLGVHLANGHRHGQALGAAVATALRVTHITSALAYGIEPIVRLVMVPPQGPAVGRSFAGTQPQVGPRPLLVRCPACGSQMWISSRVVEVPCSGCPKRLRVRR
jgi:hypothetical protein